MRKAHLLIPPLIAGAIAGSRAGGSEDFRPETIIALERAALDRWGNGDPQGYLETYAPDITYFDPSRERRLDGLATITEYYLPITGKIKVDRYEMIGPKVQRQGDMAVLTYNLASHIKGSDGKPAVVRWNSTEVYARMEGKWKIVHSHWSYTNLERPKP